MSGPLDPRDLDPAAAEIEMTQAAGFVAPIEAASGAEPAGGVQAAPQDHQLADRGDASLLALIDRLAALLEGSDLNELEVEAGGTGLVLRKPIPVSAPVAAPVPPVAPSAAEAAAAGRAGAEKPAVHAPLTGIFYASPNPSSPPYVRVGGEVAVGQIIGLIEAMKLFNEIKSDIAGRVVRFAAESGQLVKARQPLIEVDPL